MMVPLIDTVVGGRNLQHHGPDILGVEEGHEVDHVGVGRERLVFPVRQTRPIDDLIGLALGAADHRLKHQVEIDRRHAPDDRLDSATLDGATGKFVDREIRLGERWGRQA